MADCVTKETTCKPQVLQQAQETFACESFSVCLPFGGRLWSNGECLQYAEGTPPPDGIYNRIKIVNGCIVEAVKAEIPVYTPPVCAPATTPCGDIDGSMPEPSTQVGNLFKYDAAGRPLVTLNVEPGEGITIKGRGTSDDPLVIAANAAESAAIHITTGNSLIEVTGDGSQQSPYRIAHTKTGVAQTVNGMSFDDAGHFTGYTASSESGVIRGVTGQKGIDVSVDQASGLATIQLSPPIHSSKGTYVLGGYVMDVDDRNMIYQVQQSINIGAGIYRFGQYDVTLNQYGSIEAVSLVPMEVVHSTAVHYFETPATGQSMLITIDRASALYVRYTGTKLPEDIRATINGVPLAGHLLPVSQEIGVRKSTEKDPIPEDDDTERDNVTIPPFNFEAVSQAIYAAGEITVGVQSASNIPAGMLMVSLVTAV